MTTIMMMRKRGPATNRVTYRFGYNGEEIEELPLLKLRFFLVQPDSHGEEFCHIPAAFYNREKVFKEIFQFFGGGGFREMADCRDDIVAEKIGIPHNLAEFEGNFAINICPVRQGAEDGHQLGSATSHCIHIGNGVMQGQVDLDRPVVLFDTGDSQH